MAVAWYQAGRGNEVGCERQLEKAARRLGLTRKQLYVRLRTYEREGVREPQ